MMQYNATNSQPTNSDQEKSAQPSTGPSPTKKLTKEEFKALTNEQRADLMAQGMIEALRNPDNHGKTMKQPKLTLLQKSNLTAEQLGVAAIKLTRAVQTQREKLKFSKSGQKPQ